MKTKCVSDPSNHTQMCVNPDNIEIQLLKNGMKAYDQVVKNINKISDMKPEEKQAYTSMMNDVMKTKTFKMDMNDIESVTCHTDNVNNKDFLIILHTKNAIETQKYSIPVKPFSLQKNTCNGLVDSTALKSKKEHPSLFQDHVKATIASLPPK